MSSFKDLGVARWLDESLKTLSINKPSEIQKACIPAILDGRDCIGGAKTGSGKTIAFAAPMLTEWSKDPYGICGLVLIPTRELAIQIAEQLRALGATMNIRVSIIVGGGDMVQQSLELQRRPHFVVATPGRLADHIMNSGEDTVGGLRRVKYLVLDEADRLLSPSLAKDLSRCMDILPDSSKRQTLLFTATITDQVKALKDAPEKPGKKPVFMHEIASDETMPANLHQYYLLMPSYVKLAYMYALLTEEANEKRTAIVFVNRTETAERVKRTLQLLEVRTTALHSQLPQRERLNALGRFRAGAARVLVATDVASRGLDIPQVEMVVNFELPADPDDYIHRVGRTARAGRSGDSFSFVSEKDIDRVKSIEERTGVQMDLYEGITDKVVIDKALKKVSVAKREAILEMEKDRFGERKQILRKKRKLQQ